MPLGYSSDFPLKSLDCFATARGYDEALELWWGRKLGENQVNVFVVLFSVRATKGQEVAPCLVGERTEQDAVCELSACRVSVLGDKRVLDVMPLLQ